MTTTTTTPDDKPTAPGVDAIPSGQPDSGVDAEHLGAAQVAELLERQRDWFLEGHTLPVAARKDALRALRDGLIRYEDELCRALREDLGKSAHESYMCELGLVRSDITHMLRHLGRYAAEKRVRTPMAQYVSRSYVKPVPYGQVLIMSPWNYPVLLTLGPLVDALAAGNTAIVKPSAYSPATTAVMARMLHEVFPPELVRVVTGGREQNRFLLDLDFNYIFFTGGTTVGKLVMEAASRTLTPVTLELGGKSPCFVDATADVTLAAKRIVFGKFVNCGQTCVAPDYVLVDACVHDELVDALRHQVRTQYGADPLANPDYGKMVNRKHFDRVMGLIDAGKVVCGGAGDEGSLRIAPTIMDGVTWDDDVMGQEIFGPVLPVLTYDDLAATIADLQRKPNPLACYIFSSSKPNIELVTGRLLYGGGCVNDTLIHLATSSMGFGGVGASGMGSYHGKRGFETFSHMKSIVDKKTWLDLPMRYQPYTKLNDRLIRLFVR